MGLFLDMLVGPTERADQKEKRHHSWEGMSSMFADKEFNDYRDKWGSINRTTTTTGKPTVTHGGIPTAISGNGALEAFDCVGISGRNLGHDSVYIICIISRKI